MKPYQSKPEPLTIKCEACNTTRKVKRKGRFGIEWPTGWFQTGMSKWGKRYQRSGFGWYCYRHKPTHNPSCEVKP